MSELHDKAIKFVAFKRRTRQQLIDKFSEEFDINEVVAEADYMCEAGYIDETDYARRYINDAVKLKGYGPRRIIEGLEQRGIGEEIYAQLLPQTGEKLREQLQHKFGDTVIDAKQREKIIRYFVYRGYDYEQVRDCLKQMGSEETDEI